MAGKELSRELLEVLACPRDHAELTYKKKENRLVCRKNPKHVYRVEDGIPIMMVE
jgi:uncharacterized protein YbaR (Trm112 family)